MKSKKGSTTKAERYHWLSLKILESVSVSINIKEASPYYFDSAVICVCRAVNYPLNVGELHWHVPLFSFIHARCIRSEIVRLI